MLAYIKYEDKLRAIVPVRLIKNFDPHDDTDFDSSRRVQAFWTNEDGSVEGYYPGRVVALAGKYARLLIHLTQMPQIYVYPSHAFISCKQKQKCRGIQDF